ncbi:MAG TPA: LCP family protein [Solirubrobacteraceae bacterium]|jgi:LCP family protein required for cell wall assembly
MPPNTEERPYKVYRAGPRGLKSFLRGEDDTEVPGPGDPGRRRRDPGRKRRLFRGPWTVGRVIKYIVVAILGWLLLSLVLFIISAQIETGNLPSSASDALTSGGNMLFSADNVLILGTDQRPTGSKEPGANTQDAGSRSDTIMLWRIGGGTSRRLSIPRDTAVDIPGHGIDKINAAYAYGGPALTIKTVEAFTGIKINHVIIVNLAAFPQFINAIGGVDVKTGRVCADISGGTKNGGFSLYVGPGEHHLNGTQALVYARMRENKCNPADSDLTRVQHQQQILNGIKGQLFSPGTFFRLPWASWDAPKVLRTDMGGLTLLSLFAASEIGGSAPVQVLKPTGGEVLPGGGSALTVDPGAVHAAVGKLENG